MEKVLVFVKNIIWGLTVESIINIIFCTGIFTFGLDKVRKIVNAKWIGYTKIHKYGRNVKSMQKAMNKADKIYLFAYIPLIFVHDYKELLQKKVDAGCKIKVLVCNPESILLKEASIMQDVGESLANRYTEMISYLIGINQNACFIDNDNCGNIEVRKFNTEIRFPLTICLKSGEPYKAFQSIHVPPKAPTDCMMIEYSGEQCRSFVKYFETVWRLHENDAVDMSKLN